MSPPVEGYVVVRPPETSGIQERGGEEEEGERERGSIEEVEL